MSAEEIFRRLSAFVPLILFGVLVSVFAYSVRSYIQCLPPPQCSHCEKKCESLSPDKQEECKNKCQPCGEKNCVSVISNLENILFINPAVETEKKIQAELANKQLSEEKARLQSEQEKINEKLNEEQKLKQQQEKLKKDEEQLNKREAEIKGQEEAAKKADLKNREKLALGFSGRAIFVFLANLYFLVCLIGALVSFYIIYQTCKKGVFNGWAKNTFYGWTKNALYAGCMVAAAMALTGLSIVVLYNNSNWFMAVFNFLIQHGITDDLPDAAWILRSVNAFGFSICFLLYLAIVSILFSPVKRINPDGFVDAAQKMRYLRTILYVGTLMLVVGMLLIRSVHQWTLAFTTREEQALKIAENFFANLMALDGGFFTLLLAAAYLPAALIIRWQVEQISGLPQADAEREKNLQNYNLAFSFNEALPKIIAILGPILAGPVGDLFTKLIK